MAIIGLVFKCYRFLLQTSTGPSSGITLILLFCICSDGYCLLDRTPITDLSVFENVREITGFLAIEEWPGTNLCVFK